MDKQLDAKAHARITQSAGGVTVSQLAKNLIAAVDPDQIIATALATACAAFDSPELREHIESAHREREQLIDHVNLDQTVFVGYSEQALAQALPITFSSIKTKSPP
jgi:type I restriction enzyme R subunit